MGELQSYMMRIAIVEIIGHLIRELACSEDLTSDAHQTQKQLNGLYDLLIERFSTFPPTSAPKPLMCSAGCVTCLSNNG